MSILYCSVVMLQVVVVPATVGCIQVGAFKIGDTAGTFDNIIQCKLYRPGSVGLVSKSVSCHSNTCLFYFFKHAITYIYSQREEIGPCLVAVDRYGQPICLFILVDLYLKFLLYSSFFLNNIYE